MQRRGLMKGSGKRGYYNVIGRDPAVHAMSARGMKQPQSIQDLKIGQKVKAKYTGAEGEVVSKTPFAVQYRYKGEKYVRFSNPKFWRGGKIDTRFRNFIVYRVGKTPPKGTKIRLQDIGRKGHSLRMAYYKDGKWHTYQFLINKVDRDKPQAKQLIAQIKSRYPNARGGKDAPVKEIDEILGELPKDRVEITPKAKRIAQEAGAAIATGASKAYSATKEFASGVAKKLAERKATMRAKQLSGDTEYKGLSSQYFAQKERVDTIKQSIAERKEEGRGYDDLLRELETEEKQHRQLQEKIANVSVENMSDSQLKELAIRAKDESLLGFGKNQYEDELLRRIAKRKEIDLKIKQAENKPVEKTGSIFDF